MTCHRSHSHPNSILLTIQSHCPPGLKHRGLAIPRWKTNNLFLFAFVLETCLPMVELRQVVKTNSGTCFFTASITPDLGPFLFVCLFFGRTTAKDTKISCCWLAGLIYLHIYNSAPPLVANTPLGEAAAVF